MPKKEQRQLYRKYFDIYLTTLHALIADYATIDDIFPDALKGNKSVIVTVCSNGIVAAFHEHVADAFDIKETPKPVELIAQEYAEANNNFLSLRLHDTKEAADEAAKASSDRVVVNTIASSPGEYEISGIQFAYAYTRKEVVLSSFTYKPEWQRLLISRHLEPTRWSGDQAVAQAKRDVNLHVSNHLAGTPYRKPSMLGTILRVINPSEMKDGVIARLDASIRTLEFLLQNDPVEEVIQNFLTMCPMLLDPTAARIHSKVKLGREHITDFVIERPNQVYILVEIEKSSHQLFTAAGNPTRNLTHAQRQVEDWREWVHVNIAYARSYLPQISEPACWVVIGRRQHMNENSIKSLARKNVELRNIRILTYDDLLDTAKSHLANLQHLRGS